MNAIYDPMPVGERMASLLRQAAADLDEGIAPLGHPFLSENGVTLDEAYSLADHMALAFRAYLRVPAQFVMQAMVDEAVSA